MKRVFFAITICALSLALAGNSSAQSNMQLGVMLGAGIPASGDWGFADLHEELADKAFSKYHKAGFGWGVYAGGPISGLFGWRAEFTRDSMPVKKKSREISDQFADFDANYHVMQIQGGIDIRPWHSKSQPYFFFQIGVASEKRNIDATTFTGIDISTDPERNTVFGLSFGGGYNYKFTENMGIGGDIHLNMGNYDVARRWWWSPKVNVFYTF